MTFGRTLARAIILLVAVAIAGSPVRASDIDVKIDNFTFNPKQVTVKAGDNITGSITTIFRTL
jgi:plastocyanin